ncbi:MAG TPA: hypothetical protein VLH79_01105 [Chthonomonadales bacterium]|nr:hypothetical protein [Chthonomonadales bacterium]
MRIPTQRLRFTRSLDGKRSENGYLVLDIKGLDIEGASTLVVTMDEVDAVRSQGDRQISERDRLRGLLGGP